MTTFEKVRGLFAKQLCISEDSIKLESDIFVDLQADSLDLLILITAFNDEFGIAIPDKDAVTLKTIADVVNYLDSNAK